MKDEAYFAKLAIQVNKHHKAAEKAAAKEVEARQAFDNEVLKAALAGELPDNEGLYHAAYELLEGFGHPFRIPRDGRQRFAYWPGEVQGCAIVGDKDARCAALKYAVGRLVERRKAAP